MMVGDKACRDTCKISRKAEVHAVRGPGSAYQHRVSYEDIAGWFHAVGSQRAAWRRDVFRQASDPANRRYAMHVNEATTAFQREYWEHLRQHHPRLQMNEPGNKGPGSNWIYIKDRTFPRGCSPIC